MPNDPKAVLASLASAADAARQVYLTAMAANPGANLSALYIAEMTALQIWSTAQVEAFNDAPAVAPAQAALDAATAKIRGQLATLQDVGASIALVNNLVQLATTVGAFFD